MRHLIWLAVIALAAGMTACEKKDIVPAPIPIPQTDGGAAKTPSKPEAGALESAARQERDDFVAAAEKDLAEIKARMLELKRDLVQASGEAKAALQRQITALEQEMQSAEKKLAELKAATLAEWKGLRQGISAAIDQLKQSVKKAPKGAA